MSFSPLFETTLGFNISRMNRLSIASLTMGFSLIVLSSIIASLSSSRRRRFESAVASGYNDKDGEATESSLKAFGGAWVWKCIVTFSLLGFSCIIAIVIIVTVTRSDEVASPLLWCQFTGWVSPATSPTLFAIN